MSLYKNWSEIAFEHSNEDEALAFWDKYCVIEKGVYTKVLEGPTTHIKGKISDLAVEYGVEVINFVGFIDGINTSLETEIDLETITEDSEVEMVINLEKLYFNMLGASAEWLYTLPQWDNILTLEKRKEITRAYKATKTVVAEQKVGRNEPCTCGSGKKYKKCCGK